MRQLRDVFKLPLNTQGKQADPQPGLGGDTARRSQLRTIRISAAFTTTYAYLPISASS
jgi:hypothetical protein